MKKLFTFLLPVILLSQTLNGQNKKNFTLTGSISSIDSGMLYLKFWDRGKKTLDSAEIKNGEFMFKGSISEPVRADLSDDPHKMYTGYENYFTEFFIEPAEMKISLINHHFIKAILSGSKANEDFQLLNKSALPIFDSINILKRRMYGYDADKVNDSIQFYNNKVKSILFAFINNHKNSITAAIAIGWLGGFGIDKDSILSLLNFLNPDVKDGYYVGWLKEAEQNRDMASIGDQAPNFESKDITGKEIWLQNFKGKYVILDFWASWCLHCRKLTPILNKWYNSYKHKGLEIISISVDESTDNWKNAVFEDQTNQWNPVINPDGSINKLYNVVPIPDIILVNKDGKIIGRYLGEEEVKNNLGRKLKEIFK